MSDGAAVLGGVLGLALGVALGLFASHMDHRPVEACAKVLSCIDAGVSREHCDELFPGCGK